MGLDQDTTNMPFRKCGSIGSSSACAQFDLADDFLFATSTSCGFGGALAEGPRDWTELFNTTSWRSSDAYRTKFDGAFRAVLRAKVRLAGNPQMLRGMCSRSGYRFNVCAV